MKVSELTKDEQAFYTPLLFALITNPKVFDPQLNANIVKEFTNLLGSGVKYSPEDALKLNKKLSEKDMAVEKLFGAADAIFKEYWR